VIGGGDSARRFAAGLRYVTGAKLTSVWTRKREVAEAFAAHFGGATTCTLEQMLSGPVDAVYIATHPDSHHAYALAALVAGKHVLCEKPSMLNRQQLEEVLVAASIRGLLFMEAMKPPFFPLYRRLREHLEQDPIGQVAFGRAGSQIMLLQRFEAVVYDALNNRWNVGFPGASVGPRELLRTVEDLLWLITRTVEGFDQMYVHHLNDTSFRVPRFIYQLPKAHPWLGQFPISTRLGLVSHLAALFGGAAIRQQLFTDPTVPYALLAGLKSLVPSDAKQFNQKMASWPDEHKSLVFGPNYTH
jgi:hypothetical protein